MTHAWSTPARIAVCATALAISCAAPHLPPGKSAQAVDEAQRQDAMARAQVWTKTDIPAMDLRTGPTGKGAVPPETHLDCAYVQKEMGGTSPKFTCELGPDDDVKIKYGKTNPEVFGVVAATRLFWALGFGADRWYPVTVTCHNCPRDPHSDPTPTTMTVEFPVSSLERVESGPQIETYADEGWAWPELALANTEAGGAPTAQREALELLGVMVQHTDSKPEQQRLICRDKVEEAADDSSKGDKADKPKKAAAGEPAPKNATAAKGKASAEKHADAHPAAAGPGGLCQSPFMYVHDLGLTFGHRTLVNSNSASGPNFDNWRSAKVWTHTGSGPCVGNLMKSWSATLDYPVIHEAGRKFLADLLVQLSDQQLHDLFDVARFPSYTHASVDDWVTAFKAKRQSIVEAHCGADTTVATAGTTPDLSAAFGLKR